MIDTIKKVMLVDDDQNIRLVAQMTLEGLTEWQVVAADSGKAAVETAAKERPDLIMLDVMMPEMDGPTTFMKLQENPDLRGIPVIFMTAKIQTHELENYLKLGAAGVISKPFDPMTLPDEIGKILSSVKRN
jgi:CheY-like chemotaxis protein